MGSASWSTATVHAPAGGLDLEEHAGGLVPRHALVDVAGRDDRGLGAVVAVDRHREDAVAAVDEPGAERVPGVLQDGIVRAVVGASERLGAQRPPGSGPSRPRPGPTARRAPVPAGRRWPAWSWRRGGRGSAATPGPPPGGPAAGAASVTLRFTWPRCTVTSRGTTRPGGWSSSDESAPGARPGPALGADDGRAPRAARDRSPRRSRDRRRAGRSTGVVARPGPMTARATTDDRDGAERARTSGRSDGSPRRRRRTPRRSISPLLTSLSDSYRIGRAGVEEARDVGRERRGGTRRRTAVQAGHAGWLGRPTVGACRAGGPLCSRSHDPEPARAPSPGAPMPVLPDLLTALTSGSVRIVDLTAPLSARDPDPRAPRAVRADRPLRARGDLPLRRPRPGLVLEQLPHRRAHRHPLRRPEPLGHRRRRRAHRRRPAGGARRPRRRPRRDGPGRRGPRLPHRGRRHRGLRRPARRAARGRVAAVPHRLVGPGDARTR